MSEKPSPTEVKSYVIDPRALIEPKYQEARDRKDEKIRNFLADFFLGKHERGSPESKAREKLIQFILEKHRAKKEYVLTLIKHEDGHLEAKKAEASDEDKFTVKPPPLPSKKHLSWVIDIHNHPAYGLEPSLRVEGGDILADFQRSKKLGEVPLIALVVAKKGRVLFDIMNEVIALPKDFGIVMGGNMNMTILE